MGPWQLWLERLLASADPVAAFMRSAWGWPAAESVHFIGLTLLFGSIAVWDLRLLGMACGVPIVAFHRLVPFAVLGFMLNAASGSMFLMTEPDQYIYNPAFHFKLLFLTLAGVNIGVFYALFFRRVRALEPTARAPAALRVIGAVSLACWAAVIICGRLITFYRPARCFPDEPIAFIATCIIR
ncbi:MAG: hypothetical protein HYY76_19070 [Acidobacteria bacterium]|nr:hypothetical protein [Acidobacteriota bacterium]